MVRLVAKLGPVYPDFGARLHKTDKQIDEAYSQLQKHGLRLETVPALGKLGLASCLVRLRFAKLFSSYAPSILTALNEIGFATSFTEVLLSHGRDYALHLAVPFEYVEASGRFFQHLKTIGMLEHAEQFVFDKVTYTRSTMKWYDISRMTWQFSWSSLEESVPVEEHQWSDLGTKSPYDMTDLLVLKELQINPTAAPSHIAERLNLPVEDVRQRLSGEGAPSGLTFGYRFVWNGAPPPWRHQEMSFMYSPHRPVLSLAIIARQPSPNVVPILRTSLYRVPYLRYEALGRDYFARVVSPPESAEDLLYYLEEAWARLECEIQFWFENPTNSLSFTVPYHLYDKQWNRWSFSEEALSKRFDSLVKLVTGEPSKAHPLVTKLRSVPRGKSGWKEYQLVCGEILDYCLVPPLGASVREWTNVKGRHRLDLIFPLPYDSTGFWEDIKRTHGSTSLVVECKNYSNPIPPNQVVVTSKYFGPKKAGGSFGIIFSRLGPSDPAKDEQLERWTLHDEIILCLSDSDLIDMIDLKVKGLKSEELIGKKYREFRQLV